MAKLEPPQETIFGSLAPFSGTVPEMMRAQRNPGRPPQALEDFAADMTINPLWDLAKGFGAIATGNIGAPEVGAGAMAGLGLMSPGARVGRVVPARAANIMGDLAPNRYDDTMRAVSNAMGEAPKLPTPIAAANYSQPGIRAYHGSPHDFDRFDMSKIGTGEGAQSYGHGLYMAQNPTTAQFYKDALSNRRPDQFMVGESTYPGTELARRIATETNSKTHYGARSILRDLAAGQSIADMRRGNPESFAPAIDWIEKNAVRHLPQNPGRMYEVNIRARPEQFLDWDRPLGQMNPEVQSSLNKAWLAHPEAHAHQRGSQIYDAAGMQSGMAGIDQTRYASDSLRDAGIPGIKYLDQGSRNAGGWHITPPDQTTSGRWMVKSSDYNSRGMHFDTEAQAQAAMKEKVGSQTSNYVLFDDQLIDILRKYGLAGAVAGPAAAGASFGSLAPAEQQ